VRAARLFAELLGRLNARLNVRACDGRCGEADPHDAHLSWYWHAKARLREAWRTGGYGPDRMD
jgi:hypothetical protein